CQLALLNILFNSQVINHLANIQAAIAHEGHLTLHQYKLHICQLYARKVLKQKKCCNGKKTLTLLI
ncbi:MAG: hypothetical protein PHQ44_02325, partial [Anaerovibrio sp.]|nr:hypothetical protein [Anaerovibrio sp.]